MKKIKLNKIHLLRFIRCFNMFCTFPEEFELNFIQNKFFLLLFSTKKQVFFCLHCAITKWQNDVKLKKKMEP